MSLPKSWAEVYDRLARLLADEPAAHAWIDGAVLELWGAPDPAALERSRRALAFQKASGVLLALEDHPGDLAFDIEARTVIRGVVGRYFNGVTVDGPEWRIAPHEDRPSYEEWLAAVDIFG